MSLLSAFSLLPRVARFSSTLSSAGASSVPVPLAGAALRSKTQVLRLYRRLFRLAKSWPVDSLRPGRDLGEHIRKVVRTEFRKNATVSDPVAVSQLVKAGTLEADALTSVFLNSYHDQFKRINDTQALSRQSLEATRHLLSTKMQTKYSKPTIMQRLLGINREKSVPSFSTPQERQQMLAAREKGSLPKRA